MTTSAQTSAKLPDVSRDAVLAAIREADELGRDAFLAKYGFRRALDLVLIHEGQEYDTKALYAVAVGKELPERGPLTTADYHGGRASAVRKLEKAGFEVRSLRGRGVLAPLLEGVLGELSKADGRDGDRLRQLVTREAQDAIQALLPDGWQAKGSVGQGNLAAVPWIGVFPPGAETSAKRGFYAVYLFRADGTGVYLSLNQATSQLKSRPKVARLEVLRKRALDLRSAAGLEGAPRLLDLASDTTLPRLYAAGNAEEVLYERGAVPSDAALEEDLARLTDLLIDARDSGLDFDPAFEPLHLLLKWQATIDPKTLEKHKEVADRMGSTWWARMSLKGLPEPAVAMLRAQIAEHPEATHAYLYGGGELWCTDLLGLTGNASDVAESLRPVDYADSEYGYYFRLGNFRQLPTSEVTRRLLLASNPEPGVLQGALGNQTSPLYVLERAIAGSQPSVPEDAEEPGESEPATALTMEWLEQETLWPEERLEEVIAALLGPAPQVVLAGPPGTGKTWVAERIARYLTKDEPSSREVVQFHPSYGYEEFIEGLRPVAKDGSIAFERVSGVVLRMAEEMQTGDEVRVLVIDEMNRANLPRVFGELMYLFEYRETPVNLMYTEDFSLPRALLFVGTMNTADRSIRSIDSALRRRFEVFECPPDAAILTAYYENDAHANQVEGLIAGFESLNVELTRQLDRHHTVGHTFFMAEEMTPARLRAVWQRKIFPLIEEYFFDQPDLAADFSLESFWPSLND